MALRFISALVQKAKDAYNKPIEEMHKQWEEQDKKFYEERRKRGESEQVCGKNIHYCMKCHAYAPILPLDWKGCHENCGGSIAPILDITKESFDAMSDEEKEQVKDYLEQYIINRNKEFEAARLQWLAANTPKCPMCHSTNFTKISTLSRSASVAAFGLASSSIGKQYKCNKCGHKW